MKKYILTLVIQLLTVNILLALNKIAYGDAMFDEIWVAIGYVVVAWFFAYFVAEKMIED